MLLPLFLCAACSTIAEQAPSLPKTPPKEMTAPAPAHRETGPRKVGRKAGEAVRQTGQAIGKAGKRVGETVKTGAQTVGQAIKEGGEKLEKAASDVGKGIKEGIQDRK